MVLPCIDLAINQYRFSPAQPLIHFIVVFVDKFLICVYQKRDQSLQMAESFSISKEMMSAVGFRSVQERSKALLCVIQRLSEADMKKPSSTLLSGEVISALHNQTLARIYNDMQGNAPLSEIDMIAFALNAQMDHITCAFSCMTTLSADRIELAFTCRTPDLLMIFCRTLNFAWSTVHLILMLRYSPPSVDLLEILCEEYHEISILQAQRFVRFLKVHRSKQNLLK